MLGVQVTMQVSHLGGGHLRRDVLIPAHVDAGDRQLTMRIEGIGDEVARQLEVEHQPEIALQLMVGMYGTEDLVEVEHVLDVETFLGDLCALRLVGEDGEILLQRGCGRSVLRCAGPQHPCRNETAGIEFARACCQTGDASARGRLKPITKPFLTLT